MEKNKKIITRENYKKLVALGLAATIALGLSGCKEKKTMFAENDLLHDARVFNADGNVVIGKYYYISNCLTHPHYQEIVSGMVFTDDFEKECCVNGAHKFSELKMIGTISNYLTEEELIKANEDNLTDVDIVKIIARIQNEEIEEEKTLTKKSG